ncbi:MAG TPA: sugar ABC transporter permease [Chloroflexota bacterium]|nr:sugar ABC transporter permease [Chloroflexota bacterium]
MSDTAILAGTRRGVPERKRRVSARTEERLAGFLFASPFLVGLLLFTVIPVLASIYYSFCNYPIIASPKWIGLHNFVEMFTNDPQFITSIYNTMYMVVIGVPIGTVSGLIIALMLNQKVKGLAVIRTVYYMPSQFAGVALALLWGWLLNPQFGVVSNALFLVGIKAPLWLGDPAWVKPSFILMGLWGVGGAMIIWLAGLQSIPESLYEAAHVDGATSWLCFWKITLPLLSPTTFFVVTTSVIATFQIFTQAYVLTGGGPADASLFYALYLFNEAFQYFRMGYASAMAWVLFVIIMLLTLLQLKLAQSWVYYEAVKE